MSGSAAGAARSVAHATALSDLRRFDEAVALLRQTIAIEPENAKAYCQLSRALLGIGGHDAEALAAARSAIAIQPENEWPYRLGSLALSASGQHGDAIAMARTAIRLAPDQPYAHTALARALARSGTHLDEAQAAVTRAIALSPHDIECHMALGAVAMADSRYDDATTAFHQVLALDPDNSAALNELARVQLNQRRFDAGSALAAAAGGFADAVRIDPRAQVSRRNLDLVLHLFLTRLAYVIFLIAWFGRVAGDSSTLNALPALLLVVPGWFAVRFWLKLNPQLRGHLLTVARQPTIAVAAILDGAAIVCLVIGALASAGSPLSVAAVLALAARLMLFKHGRNKLGIRPRRSRQQRRSRALWILTLVLIFVGIVLATRADSNGNSAEAATSVAVLAAAMVCLFLVVRSSRRQ